MNIYLIWEEDLGADLQPSLFRYQQTYLGASIITVSRDFDYVTSSLISGRSALSTLAWALSTALLAAAGYHGYSRSDGIEAIRKTLALLTAGGAVAYLLSCVAQYGPTLHGPAGFAVPVGVPLILAVAGYIMTAEEDDELEDEEEEGDYGGEGGQ